jgi:hypothetical protein
MKSNPHARRMLLSSLFKRKHFGFKLSAFLAEALTCFDIYEAHLNKVDFGPTRALGIEVPRRIWRVFAFAINREHAIILSY